MDEEEYIRIASEAMNDDKPITIHLQIKDLWFIDSALSLAYRHPGLTNFIKAKLVHISQQLRQPMIAEHPDVAPLMEMGWHEENDQPIDYEKQADLNAMMDEKLKKWKEESRKDHPSDLPY